MDEVLTEVLCEVELVEILVLCDVEDVLKEVLCEVEEVEILLDVLEVLIDVEVLDVEMEDEVDVVVPEPAEVTSISTLATSIEPK